MKWDNSVEHVEHTMMKKGSVNVQRAYCLFKSQMPMGANDLDNKVFACWENGKLYMITSSCYDTSGNKLNPSQQVPLPGNTTRMDILYDIYIIERMEDGKVKVTFAQSHVPTSSLPRLVIEESIPTGIKSFYTDLQKFYIKNHKEI